MNKQIIRIVQNRHREYNAAVITRALVVGAGIAGMQAALDIANSGHEVVLVERLPSIGGHMAQLSETFPTLDCSQCILTPRTVEVGHHENIRLHTYSQVEAIEGQAGDFQVRIRRRAAYVDWDSCTGCGTCQEKCPAQVVSDFERSIGQRKAIYISSAQAVPNKPVIDAQHCRYLTSKADIEEGRVSALTDSGKPRRPKCGICARVCPTDAIAFEQGDTLFEERVGAIVLATGYDLLSATQLPEYGGGKLPDVIDGLAFERLLSASGPTAGAVRRPSDGTEPKEVVFVQCSGSRDPERGVPYCSKICCMYTAKHAMLYKHRVPDGNAYVFYIDIRAGGKGYEEFVTRATEEAGVVYMRGKVSKIMPQDGRLVVWGADTLSGEWVEIGADMVVLATAVLPAAGSERLAGILGLPGDGSGFYVPANAEILPVESDTPGVFLAGAALGPRDIPETVAQASGAAAKVLKLFASAKRVQLERA
jgi:heterodisulfide reductase subunit A